MKKILLFSFLFLILFINACAKTQQEQQITQIPIQLVSSEDISTLTPEQVVTLYFQSWNDERYDIMYSLISDGFKQIEPTAKSFSDFKANMEKFYDTFTGIEIVEVIKSYQNDKEAGVNYKINDVGKNGKKIEFSSTYTLRKRTSGWKLIHHYGKNIDTT